MKDNYIIKKLITTFLIILAPLFAYYPSLGYYFSQDDFIHLSASKVTSAEDFFAFFNPFASFPDIFFFRPLPTQVHFFLNGLIFNHNPYIFHVETLLVHIATAFLVFFIINLLFNSFKMSLLSSVFYGLSAVHFLSLYYISAFQQTSRTLYLMLATILFLKYLQKKSKKLIVFSTLFYLFSLLSKETSIIFPLLLFPLAKLLFPSQKKVQLIKKVLTASIPIYLITIAYLSIRLWGFFLIFDQGSYKITFSPVDIFQNFKWQFLWLFGLPEIISTYPSIRLSSIRLFFFDFPESKIILFSLVVFMLFFAGLVAMKKDYSLWRNICLLLIFFIPLTPTLILKGHQYPHYLDLSLLGFLIFLSSALSRANLTKKIFSLLMILSFVTLQLSSINLSRKTHWTTDRSQVAKKYQLYLQKYHPQLSTQNIAFIGTPSQLNELKITLAKNYAVKFWYPQIGQVLYQSKADNLPENTLVIPISQN